MRRSRQFAYLGCSFSIGIFSSFNNFTLTLWLSGFTSSYLLLGLLGNTRSFEGTLIAPGVGFWSDHVWLGWLGRRRPFILVGGLSSSLLLALTPAFSHVPVPAALGWLPKSAPQLVPAIAIIFLFTMTFNAMTDIHDALLIDLTSESERNRLSALRVVVYMAGSVAILVLGSLIWKNGVPDSAFAITAALMAAGVLLTVLAIREPSPAVWAADRAAPIEQAGERFSARTTIRRYPGAAVLCVVAFFYWSGVNAVLPLVSIYVKNILHATIGEAQILPALLLLSTTVLALPMAKLGNRYGKRRVIAGGYALIATISLAGLVITTKEQGAVVFLLAGVGNAACLVLTVPLMADLVPRRHIGAATGILAGSGSLAAPIASLVAGTLSDAHGPRVIFLLMSVCVAIALLLLPFVHPLAAEVSESPADPPSLVIVEDSPPEALSGI